MIDFILDCSNICWGVVESSDGESITIPKNEWAPGIWAGSEGVNIEIVEPISGRVVCRSVVMAVDLENGIIKINTFTPEIRPGSLIYPERNREMIEYNNRIGGYQ